jgi:hypothetical protein
VSIGCTNGHANLDDARFCSTCGQSISAGESPPPPVGPALLLPSSRTPTRRPPRRVLVLATAVAAVAIVVIGLLATLVIRGSNGPGSAADAGASSASASASSTTTIPAPEPTNASSKPSQSSTPAQPPAAQPLRLQFSKTTYPENARWIEFTWTAVTASGGEPGVADAMNAQIKAWAEPELKSALSGRRDTSLGNPNATVQGYVTRETEAVPCARGYLCLRMLVDDLAPGNMMHAAVFKTLVLNKSSGSRASLSDFMPTEALGSATAAVLDAYRVQCGSDALNTDLTMEVFQSWIPMKQGIWFSFHDYQLGSCPVETIVTYSTLSRPTDNSPAPPQEDWGPLDRYSIAQWACYMSSSDVPPVTDNSASSEWIYRLESILFNAGYYPGLINGTWDSETMSAVIFFQSDRGLTVDGQVGPETWRSLLTDYCGH